MRFKLKFTSIQGGFGNIFLISSTSQDCCSYGDRIPGIWIRPSSSSLYIILGNKANGDFRCSDATRALELNVWHSIEIYVIGDTMRTFLNGAIEQSCTSGGDRPPATAATIYASSPYYAAAPALVSNLLYEDLSGHLASTSGARRARAAREASLGWN